MKIKLTHESYKTNSYSIIDDAMEITRLEVSRNQTASFQILFDTKKKVVINTSNKMALLDNIELPVLRVQCNSTLDCTVFNEGFLKDENDIEYADILTHNPFLVHPGNRLSAVWIDVKIPSDILPGEYHIDVLILETKANADEHLVHKESITVSVLDFILPDPKDYSMYLDLWQHNSNVARFYEVPLWGDEHFEILKNVVSSLAELGQKSVMILASEAPWNGWGTHIMSKDGSNLFEHSIIDVFKNKNGKLYCDFTSMQRYIDLCAKHDIDGDISIYGLLGVWETPLYPQRIITDYPEKLQIRYYDENTETYKLLTSKSEVLEYIKQIFDYFDETGQIHKVRIAADEPKNEADKIKKYMESIDLIRSVAPDAQFKIAFDKDPVIDIMQEKTKDIATSFPCTTRKYKSFDSDKKKLWYVCNIPDKPNTFLRSPLLEARLLGTLNSLFGFDGLLRWAYTAWTKNPQEDIRYAPQGFPPGDICLVYPEKNGQIAKSLRWKALKRGIEDFELINQLKILGKDKKIMKAYEIINLNINPSEFMKGKRDTIDDFYSEDYLDYDLLRRHLIDSLSQ